LSMAPERVRFDRNIRISVKNNILRDLNLVQ
jgi:hypothetical protein